MMNKKGHIGTTLMVFGALILVVVTLFSFVSFNEEIGNRHNKFRVIHKELDFEKNNLNNALKVYIEDAIRSVKNSVDFENDLKMELKKYAELKHEKDSGTNFYGKIVNGDYDVNSLEGEVYELKLENIFIKRETDKIVMNSNFDYNVRFDRGKIIEFEKIPK